jgi:dihydropteroate synthase
VVREVAGELRQRLGLDAQVAVLNIQVAALMSVEWIARKLDPALAVGCARVLLPGHCKGDLADLSAKLGVPVERGPKEIFELPAHLGAQRRAAQGYGEHRIQIIAEINHAADLPLEQIVAQGQSLREQGADVIDLGCDPQTDRPAWRGVGDAVRALRDAGLSVSVDSFHVEEIAAACRAGAQLVLSVNSQNRDAAADWGAEVVVIPDDPHTLGGLDETIAHLQSRGVPLRVDPVLEPIGLGFADSLARYVAVRRRYPDLALMMGVGNLSEMTEVDSAGVNALLIGFCEELNIASVLTTQVINWARTSVAEIDVARRLMHHAVRRRTVPKHVDRRLVMLRDPRLRELGPQALADLQRRLTDRNIRLFAERGQIHAMNKDVYAADADPFAVFEKLGIDEPGHAFYLGFEMAKALIALTLGKNYVQDQPLDFGMLTRGEVSHYRRKKRKATGDAERAGDAPRDQNPSALSPLDEGGESGGDAR